MKTKTKPKKVKLIPPDPKHCQKRVLTPGCYPVASRIMALGGQAKLVDCGKTPSHIVHELKPGEDGLKGSMSLCPGCLAEFIDWKQGELKDFRIEEIKRK